MDLYPETICPLETPNLARNITVLPTGIGIPKYQNFCDVCGDKSTGKHYGSQGCCEGCKGFFRRNVRSKKTFSCRFGKDCDVTLKTRGECKHCRFQKCLKVGMDPQAVQAPRVPREDTELLTTNELDLTCLVLADAAAKGKQYEYLKSILGDNLGKRGMLSDHNLCDRMTGNIVVNSEFLMMVEWARNIPGFKSLSLEDQVPILRSHAAECYILAMGFRSIGCQGYLVNANGDLLPRKVVTYPEQSLEGDTSLSMVPIRNRVMDEISTPFGEIGVDEIELNCLKAMILLDPNVQGVVNSKKLWALRNQAQALLSEYVKLKVKEDGWQDTNYRLMKLFRAITNIQGIGRNWLEYHVSTTNDPAGIETPKLMKDLLFQSPIC